MAKGNIMHYLCRVPDASAADVAAGLGLSLPAAGMALLRLTRGGLMGRTFDPQYSYALTDKGRARLAFFEAEEGSRPPRREAVSQGRSSPRKGDVTVKRKKLHTGAYHCPACFIEFDLVAEESLRCDQCQGPLAKGPLDDIWDDDEDGGHDEDAEDDE